MEQTAGGSHSLERHKTSALDIPELYRCVHCGLCLNHCPTYRTLRLEPDSPRGRIHLVQAAANGRIDLGRGLREHLDLCLLCRACETACPSGVQFGHIAEAARQQLGLPGSAVGRLILHLILTRVICHNGRMRAAATALKWYQRSAIQRLVHHLLPERLQEMEALLPSMPGKFFTPRPGVYAPTGSLRAKAAFFNGCIMPLLFPDVNEATVRVLQRNGCEVALPGGQTCCGALNVHNGEVKAAKKMARRNIDAFLAGGSDMIVVNAAGCGAMLKEYARLLADDPEYAKKAQSFSSRVQDSAEFLAGLGMVGELGRLPLTVTYQDPCHLAHGQRIRTQPRQLLQAIPGITLIEMESPDRCCGSAGIYNVTQREMSHHLLREKMQAIDATKAEAVVAPNPGCMLQLRYGARRYGPSLRVFHLMDLLEQSYGIAAGLSTRL
ncbi:MAG TPA: (Fe-S)-binding protein [Terriglobales bacterium]|nr:(Fe-S)-binding protein [Terriglobales bacterium]